MNRVLASVLLLTAFAARAETPLAGDGALSLDQAVSVALQANAELRSLRAKTLAVRERPAQVGALPNPMASYGGMDSESGGDWPNTAEKRIMVQQAFPWFGKRTLRKEIAVQEAEGAQRDLDAMTKDVVMRVKDSYSGLYAVRQVMAVTHEEEDVLGRMATVAETMYAAGTRPQTDVLQLQSEITLLKQKLLELRTQENTLLSRLNLLLARKPDFPVGPLEKPRDSPFNDDVDSLLFLAVKNRPEIQAAQAQIDRFGLEQKLMAKESLPDYTLGLEYRSLREADDMLMFTVSVELPFWRTKNRAGVREAASMQAASRAAREAAEQQSAFDVQDAAFQYQTARRTLKLYRAELVPQAEARFTASEAGYRAGTVNFLDLLESERFLLDAKTKTAMAEGTLGTQAARLEWAIGATVGPADKKSE